MGPQAFRILQTNWYWLQMVVRAGGYYRMSFQVFRGVTQGGPLILTVLNVVVDTVVRH